MKLSTKYIIIILMSIFIFPISYLGVNFIYYTVLMNVGNFDTEEFYNPEEIEEDWDKEINSMEGKSKEVVESWLGNFAKYPDSRVFWLNDEGELLASKGLSVTDGADWNVSSAIEFMKGAEASKFTAYAYLRGEKESGYILLQIPKSYIGSKWEVLRDRYSYVWFIALGMIWFLFIFISWVFFNKIRKRLVRMQKNMEVNENQLVPSQMKVIQNDEIGQLEHSFNRMVEELNDSREKEKSEETIRKHLIATLSHDLRTPLSIIGGHAYKLNQQDITPETRKSLLVINEKVDFIAELIDNLTSFTVLSEGKLPMNKQVTDVVAVVRSSFIDWFPIFEALDFTIEVDLDEPIQWIVDETWLRRILDNLFQNIQRHAKKGKYVSVRTIKENGIAVFKMEDRGPGLAYNSEQKGSGIGLSIVDMMLEQMQLEKRVSSGPKGTTFIILPMKTDLP